MNNGSQLYDGEKVVENDFNNIHTLYYTYSCVYSLDLKYAAFWLTHSAAVSLYCLLHRHFNHLMIMSTSCDCTFSEDLQDWSAMLN